MSLGDETVVSGNRTFSAAGIILQSLETEADEVDDVLLSGTCLTAADAVASAHGFVKFCVIAALPLVVTTFGAGTGVSGN